MAQRSPILGYNHNVGYRGLVFHVQTEDSGVNNPHIFTHLFHGGVIISTRKLEYDAEADEDVVKALMQAQHKAVLKDLKRGEFDDKIDLYLASHPDLLPRGVEPHKAPGKSSAEEEHKDGRPAEAPIPISTAEVSEAFHAIVEPQPSSRVTQPIRGPKSGQMRAPSPIAPAPPPIMRDRSSGEITPPRPASGEITPPRPTSGEITPLQPASGEISVRPASGESSSPRPADELASPPPISGSDPGIRRTPIKPPPPPVIKPPAAADPAASAPVPPRPPPPPRNPRPSGNVLVSRPPIVVDSSRRGAARNPPPAAGARPARLPPARTVREEPQDGSIFDQNLISEKSLDEVILAYLSEDSGED